MAGHTKRCSLNELPVELVVHVMKELPSLSALWGFINANARFAAIFRDHAIQITEAVLQHTVPGQTRTFLRGVIHLHSSLYPPNLDAARPFRGGLSDDFGSALVTSPEICRRFVLLAHRIHNLAHECIDHYIQRSLGMNPRELDDPTFISFECTFPPERRRTPPKGRLYQPKDSGPPSWAEEQLVILNLWKLQYYDGIRLAHTDGRLGWSAADQQDFLSMTVLEFFHLGSCAREQLLTVLAYVQKVEYPERETSSRLCLAHPPAHNRFDLGCSPEPSEPMRDLKGREIRGLEFKPDTWWFANLMFTNLKYSPLFRLSFSHFRKFGFAIWENRRMIDLGLLPTKREFPYTPWYFKWRSILCDEECVPTPEKRLWLAQHYPSIRDLELRELHLSNEDVQL
ncbi:hypothetical protein F4808DRAFT_425115 [Astrocystis sublimbata]|nr:hypothetical protein F4808DRAFT_425115 [Astrocystis sublimbata]